MTAGHGLRLLIVTDEAVSTLDELPETIQSILERASNVYVVTPNLPSHLRFWANDTNASYEASDKRLNVVLDHLKSMDIDATGQVGADDPLTAFADAICAFAPDHILIGLRAADHSGWQEHGLPDAVIARFHLPTTVFEIHSAAAVS